MAAMFARSPKLTETYVLKMASSYSLRFGKPQVLGRFSTDP